MSMHSVPEMQHGRVRCSPSHSRETYLEHMYVCMHAYVTGSTRACLCACACVHAYMHIHVHAHAHAHICMHMDGRLDAQDVHEQLRRRREGEPQFPVEWWKHDCAWSMYVHMHMGQHMHGEATGTAA